MQINKRASLYLGLENFLPGSSLTNWSFCKKLSRANCFTCEIDPLPLQESGRTGAAEGSGAQPVRVRGGLRLAAEPPPAAGPHARAPPGRQGLRRPQEGAGQEVQGRGESGSIRMSRGNNALFTL